MTVTASLSHGSQLLVNTIPPLQWCAVDHIPQLHRCEFSCWGGIYNCSKAFDIVVTSEEHNIKNVFHKISLKWCDLYWSCISAVRHTSRISMIYVLHSYHWEGGGGYASCICVLMLDVAGIKMKVLREVLGCRCSIHRGGDLGCGWGYRDGAAICLRPQGGDPASLFSLTEHTGVIARAVPSGCGKV